jgi:GR25 family glycosyltransferase involved in LPS biosynthesis
MKGALIACLLGLASAQIPLKEQDTCTPASSASGYKRRSHVTEMSQASPVKKIYFINRDADHQRYSHMKMQCKKAAGVPCEKFKAVEATKIPQMDLKQVSNGNLASWLASRKGTGKNVFAAIYSSNYRVLEKILEEAGPESEDLYMVLEDDSILASDWKASLKEVLSHTPADWQLLKVGYWGEQRCQDKVNRYVSALQYPSVDKAALGEKHFYSGNTGYVVKAKNIPKILSILKEHSIGAIENAWMYPTSEGSQVISYTVTPPFKLVTVTHDFGRSNKNFLQKSSTMNRDHETASAMVQETKAASTAQEQADAMSHPRAYNDIPECVEGAAQREQHWKPQTSKEMAKFRDVRKIVYINTQKNDDRDAHMQELFANISMNLMAEGKDPKYNLPEVERFQAVTRDDIQKKKIDLSLYSSGKEHAYMLKYPTVTREVTKAIWTSHAKALENLDAQSRKKKMHSSDDDLYLIMEDDTFFDDKWKSRLQQLVHNTPDDFDMIKLGYWGNRHCVDRVNKFIYQANGPTFSNDKLFYQGNSGYAVKRGSIKKILAALKEKDIMDIDGAFLTSAQDCSENCLKVYAAAGSKQVISDINLGTMRVPTKKNGMSSAGIKLKED